MNKKAWTLVAALLFAGCAKQQPQTAPSTFSGPSEQLAATEILPTLDAKIADGKNAIWCASFLSAWKELQTQTGEPLGFDKESLLARLLNQAADPRAEIPTDSLYVAAGKVNEGFMEKVQDDLRVKFPGKEPPNFDAPAGSVVAYAYLSAGIKFPVPYFQNREPLAFTTSAGATHELRSFGIRREDQFAYGKLRAQTRVLFQKGGQMEALMLGKEEYGSWEFAVDLCAGSETNQLVVAVIEKEPSVAEALARIERETEAMTAFRKTNTPSGEYRERVVGNDTLQVPDICWRISHRFAELEGKSITNASLQGLQISQALQEISFRLDRSGTELESEARMVAVPIPAHFVVNRPFLVYLKKRGAKMPYFAMWVDNAELLQPWGGQRASGTASTQKSR